MAATPIRISGTRVQCLVDPEAEIDLYADRAGEASQFLGTGRADRHDLDVDPRGLAPDFDLDKRAELAANATAAARDRRGSLRGDQER